jgi:hypothetical protein
MYGIAHARYLTLFKSPVLCPASLFQTGRRRKKKILNTEKSKHVNFFEISEIFRYNFRRSWKENNYNIPDCYVWKKGCCSLFCQLLQTPHDAGINNSFIFAVPHTSTYTFEKHVQFRETVS